MTIEQQLNTSFAPDIRRRGHDYFTAGRVTLSVVQDEAVLATVQGGEVYTCRLQAEAYKRLKEVVVAVDCSCPAFAALGPCKHLWALVLELDRQSWGSMMANAKRIILEAAAIESPPPRARLPSQRRSPSALHPSRRESSEEVSWEQFRRQMSHERELPSVLAAEVLNDKPECDRQLAFVLDLRRELENQDLLLRFFARDRMQGSRLGMLKAVSLRRQLDASFNEGDDHGLFDELRKELDGFVELNSRQLHTGIRVATGREPMQGFLLPAEQALPILARLHRAERLFAIPLHMKKPDPRPLKVGSQIWQAEAQLEPHPSGDYRLEIYLSDGEQRRDPRQLHFLAGGRLLCDDMQLYPCNISEQQLRDWVGRLREGPAVLVPKVALDRFIGEYALIPSAPAMRWPEESAWREELDQPRPTLRLTAGLSAYEWWGELILRYRRGEVNLVDPRSRWIDTEARCIYLRDFNAEQQLTEELCALDGIFRTAARERLEMGCIARVPLKTLPEVVENLEDRGWDIEVENRRLRLLRNFTSVVEGTNDWLDLEISTNLDAQTYDLPTLLRGRKPGEAFIPLGHGTCALLPEAWARRMELLEQAGERDVDGIRLPTRQALLLDSLLGDLQVEDRSQHLAALKIKIKNFQALVPRDPAPSFQGQLRDYQREGLAWLTFLRDFGFGGCLADDMGLGKTVQVLALLQEFHGSGAEYPSLIVVPRSLIGNWQEEAARFCPDLRVLDCSGGSRDWNQVSEADLILITYGTLRQDIEELRRLRFAYVILDESQAIKNVASQTAKASFLLQAQHRLAMSGTPIENHLGELRSLLQFLNPGLLDSGPWPRLLQKNSDLNDPHIKLLNQALKPLVLRRTKSEVLRDLPPKVEHTLYCELEGEQRRLYDELRDHYRRHLLPELQEGSWHKSPLILIEALLRLRQAACHPALVSLDHSQVPSAKLELLLEKLQELQESGHKALIFSQFTGFLKIVAARLDSLGQPYEYLDGQTRDRSARVARFQTDPSIPFFLISLKAGGVGLNLTAADYCFILDPWWNPAAEAQAIDRAHRIHQKNTVFAYRLIARDTVEEKIQQMQEEKREMAASILAGDSSLLQHLNLDVMRSLFI